MFGLTEEHHVSSKRAHVEAGHEADPNVHM